MKTVLKAVSPKQCANIANGQQVLLVCKTAPKEVPFKCYTYETKGETEISWVDEDGHFIFKGRGQVIGEFICDKVFSFYGRAVSYQKARNLFYKDHDVDNGIYGVNGWDTGVSFVQIDPHAMFKNNNFSKMGLSVQELFDYVGINNRATAWHITDLKIYDKPKEVSEFGVWCKEFEKEEPFCVECDYQSIDWSAEPAFYCKCNGFKPLSRPPQSWQYVEELRGEK